MNFRNSPPKDCIFTEVCKCVFVIERWSKACSFRIYKLLSETKVFFYRQWTNTVSIELHGYRQRSGNLSQVGTQGFRVFGLNQIRIRLDSNLTFDILDVIKAREK